MIGHFITSEDADMAIREFNNLGDVIQRDFDYDRFDDERLSVYENGPLHDALMKLGFYHFSAEDIEHFVREHSAERTGNQIEIRTDEYDVNGFLKFLITKGARVEVYSAHNLPDATSEET